MRRVNCIPGWGIWLAISMTGLVSAAAAQWGVLGSASTFFPLPWYACNWNELSEPVKNIETHQLTRHASQDIYCIYMDTYENRVCVLVNRVCLCARVCAPWIDSCFSCVSQKTNINCFPLSTSYSSFHLLHSIMSTYLQNAWVRERRINATIHTLKKMSNDDKGKDWNRQTQLMRSVIDDTIRISRFKW